MEDTATTLAMQAAEYAGVAEGSSQNEKATAEQMGIEEVKI